MTTTTNERSLWIRRFHPVQDPEARLVCLPHAGGSAIYFFSTSKSLHPRCEVLAVQYPGRQDRRAEKCITNIPDLADSVATQLLPWTDRPLALFGHSMGAILAFEVARRLEKKAISLVALFVSGRRAPSRHRAETVHLRNDDELVKELHALDGTDRRALDDEEILRMSLPAIRADYTATETYRYKDGPAIRVPIYAHVGTEDPKVTLEEAGDWKLHTCGAFKLQTYPGGHFYLNQQSDRLIESIKQVMFSHSEAG